MTIGRSTCGYAKKIVSLDFTSYLQKIQTQIDTIVIDFATLKKNPFESTLN